MVTAINTNAPSIIDPPIVPEAAQAASGDASAYAGAVQHIARDISAVNHAIVTTGQNSTSTRVLLQNMFSDVRAYGVVGLWSLTNAEMRNISNTQDVQQSLMDLEQVVETLSTNWSNKWTNQLSADENKVQTDAKNPQKWDPQTLAAEISADTSQYNFDSTNMQTFGSFFSSLNNLLSNGVSNAGQNLSTDGSTIQQVVMKIMDSLSQLLGSV